MRTVRIAALALACAACHKGSSAVLVLRDATLLSVSADEKAIAFSAAFATNVGTASVADVSVLEPATGKQTTLSLAGFDAAFARDGSTLLYETNAAVSTDPAPAGSTAPTYGSLVAWRPGMAVAGQEVLGAANELSISRVAAADDAWVLTVNATAPSTAGPLRVLLARTAPALALTVVAANVSSALLTASPDDRWAAVRLPQGSGTQALLVNTADGSTRVLGSSPGGLGVSFSSDGALVATEQQGAVSVLATATLAPVAWAALPSGYTATGVSFASGQRLIVRARDQGGAPSLFLTTAAGARQIYAAALSGYDVPRSPPGADRYLFVTAPRPGTDGNDLEVLDLDAAEPRPVTLPGPVNGFPAVADDLAACRYLGGYDATARTGAATVALLPAGAQTTVATGITNGAFNFATGSSRLLFYGGPSLFEWSAGHAASLLEANVFNWRVRNGRLYFTQQADDGSIQLAREPLP